MAKEVASRARKRTRKLGRRRATPFPHGWRSGKNPSIHRRRSVHGPLRDQGGFLSPQRGTPEPRPYRLANGSISDRSGGRWLENTKKLRFFCRWYRRPGLERLFF